MNVRYKLLCSISQTISRLVLFTDSKSVHFPSGVCQRVFAISECSWYYFTSMTLLIRSSSLHKDFPQKRIYCSGAAYCGHDELLPGTLLAFTVTYSSSLFIIYRPARLHFYPFIYVLAPTSAVRGSGLQARICRPGYDVWAGTVCTHPGQLLISLSHRSVNNVYLGKPGKVLWWRHTGSSLKGQCDGDKQ